MFTGLIVAVGSIVDTKRVGGDLRLRIAAADLPLASFAEGESIAVSGVCLTAIELDSEGFSADVSGETLATTTLGEWQVGDRVNLEPSLALGDRLGGHLVTGHVDGLATIAAQETDARSTRLTLTVPAALGRYIARKGSVALDGISLTVNDVTATTFEVNIIPHTWAQTNLSGVKLGQSVNIEVDLMARYVARFLTGDPTQIDREFLKEHGYER